MHAFVVDRLMGHLLMREKSKSDGAKADEEVIPVFKWMEKNLRRLVRRSWSTTTRSIDRVNVGFQ